MPRNIELKARLRDPAWARSTAVRLATQHLGIQKQRDTYFLVPHGRLKLREIAGQPAQLVQYARDNRATAKASDYTLVPVPDPVLLCAALTESLGIRVVVEKRREVFLHHNVRIHLDEVVGLGSFLEFEAVLDDIVNDLHGTQQVAFLSIEFGLHADDLVSESYSDLLEKCQ